MREDVIIVILSSFYIFVSIIINSSSRRGGFGSSPRRAGAGRRVLVRVLRLMAQQDWPPPPQFPNVDPVLQCRAGCQSLSSTTTCPEAGSGVQITRFTREPRKTQANGAARGSASQSRWCRSRHRLRRWVDRCPYRAVNNPTFVVIS